MGKKRYEFTAYQDTMEAGEPMVCLLSRPVFLEAEECELMELIRVWNLILVPKAGLCLSFKDAEAIPVSSEISAVKKALEREREDFEPPVVAHGIPQGVIVAAAHENAGAMVERERCAVIADEMEAAIAKFGYPDGARGIGNRIRQG